MYYYGGGSTCGYNQMPYYPMPYPSSNNNSIYAIILVLFILLVIVLGTRWGA